MPTDDTAESDRQSHTLVIVLVGALVVIVLPISSYLIYKFVVRRRLLKETEEELRKIDELLAKAQAEVVEQYEAEVMRALRDEVEDGQQQGQQYEQRTEDGIGIMVLLDTDHLTRLEQSRRRESIVDVTEEEAVGVTSSSRTTTGTSVEIPDTTSTTAATNTSETNSTALTPSASSLSSSTTPPSSSGPSSPIVRTRRINTPRSVLMAGEELPSYDQSTTVGIRVQRGQVTREISSTSMVSNTPTTSSSRTSSSLSSSPLGNQNSRQARQNISGSIGRGRIKSTFRRRNADSDSDGAHDDSTEQSRSRAQDSSRENNNTIDQYDYPAPDYEPSVLSTESAFSTAEIPIIPSANLPFTLPSDTTAPGSEASTIPR